MHSQLLCTARLGVVREPKGPMVDVKAEVAKVTEWYQVSIPGSVLGDLLQNGAIPDPYKDFNSRSLDWVAASRFLYVIPFRAQKKTRTLENAFLCLDGVDTAARAYLNGRLVMRPSDAFCRWEVDVTSAIRWGGDNLLVIVLDPLAAPRTIGSTLPTYDPMGHPQRLAIRRCQMGFGWDFVPPLAGQGLRREVRIDYRGSAWIDELWVHTIYARREAAYMEVKWKVRSVAARFEVPLRLTFKLDKAGEEQKIVVPIEKFRPGSDAMGGGFYEAWGAETVTWTNPPLWFPHTHGEPRLHPIEADLRSGGVLWHRQKERYGLRIVEIERKPGPYNRETMRILVNGVPVFARGANWVPSDAIRLDGAPDRLEHLLRKAKALRMNLLRVWGGGIYESEDFYRICDEMGILVWQDFPFAKGPYPVQDERFLATVNHEATDNIRRLRRHASLALLCGNSAVQKTYRETPEWNRRGPLECENLFTTILPRLCEAEAPGVPYLETSPSGGDDPNEPLKGDRHAWVWWTENRSHERATRPIPSFLSEFGVPTAPDPRTIEQYISHKHHHLASGIAEHTLKNHHAIMLKHIEAEDAKPDWDRYLTRGWEMQSRVVSDIIERLRVAPDECGGSLIWTLNEPFPGFSWSMLDWKLRPKPIAFRVQQSYADVVMRFVEEDSPLELRVMNDRAEPLVGELRVNLVSLDGEKLYQKEMSVEIGAREMAIPWREALEVHTHLPRNTFLVAARIEHEGGVIRAHHYPVPVASLLVPKGEVVLTVRPGKSETTMQFRSEKFVRWILLQSDAPGTGSALIGFDLVPGEPVICGLSPKAHRARVRALSPGLQPRTFELTEKQSYVWKD